MPRTWDEFMDVIRGCPRCDSPPHAALLETAEKGVDLARTVSDYVYGQLRCAWSHRAERADAMIRSLFRFCGQDLTNDQIMRLKEGEWQGIIPDTHCEEE